MKDFKKLSNENPSGFFPFLSKRRAEEETAEQYARMARELDEKAAMIEQIAMGNLNLNLNFPPHLESDRFNVAIRSLIEAIKKVHTEADIHAVSIANGALDCRSNPEQFNGVFSEIIKDFNLIQETIAVPFRDADQCFAKISAGAFPERVPEGAKGFWGDLNRTRNACIDTMHGFADELIDFSASITGGHPDARAVIKNPEGIFADLLRTANNIADTYQLPLQLALSHMEQIAAGEVPDKLQSEVPQAFKSMKDLMNRSAANFAILAEIKLALGRVSQRGYSASIQGDCTGVFSDIAEIVNRLSGQIQQLNNLLGKVAAGDLEGLNQLKQLSQGNEQDSMLPAIISVMERIHLLAEEARMLSEAAVEGDLSRRGDETKFEGEYAKIIGGINQTLDAMTESAFEIKAVLTEAASGNLRAAVHGDYKGDHAVIKHALNGTMESILSYISDISHVLSEISSRNLDLNITTVFQGDFSEIGNSLDKILQIYNQILNELAAAADQISSGSRQVSDGSQFLAQGAAEQASSIQQLTASISEIAAQSRDNAAKAEEVFELAKGARDGGAKGKETMNEMLLSMREINDSSVNISKIIKVIDDIAFQTNILALNAAVEAARAGNHGKGFAVVAEEVRNLAARSAKAAQETTDLIEGSIHKVQTGTRITNEIAAVLQEIADGAVISTEKLSIIAQASSNQADAISQINSGIEQISRVVQNNSATAEQSAASSQELSSQAELLKEMLSRFKIRRESSAPKYLGGEGSGLLWNKMLQQDTIPLAFGESDKY